MKNISFTIFILLLSVNLFAQKEKKSTGEYQINLTRSELSENQACKQCMELARVQAIEKVFGTVIVQGNATMVKNSNTGELVETEQLFNMIAETYVNEDCWDGQKADPARIDPLIYSTGVRRYQRLGEVVGKAWDIGKKK